MVINNDLFYAGGEYWTPLDDSCYLHVCILLPIEVILNSSFYFDFDFDKLIRVNNAISAIEYEL